MVRGDPKITAMPETQNSTSAGGTRGGSAPGEYLQGQDESEGYLGYLHREIFTRLWDRI